MGVCVVKSERKFGESGCVCRRCAIGPPFEDGESDDDTDDVGMASFRPCRSSAQGRGGSGGRRSHASSSFFRDRRTVALRARFSGAFFGVVWACSLQLFPFPRLVQARAR
jgi:hypothetical protein